MSKTRKIEKMPRERNIIAFQMNLTKRGGPMKDRRSERGGSKMNLRLQNWD